MKAGEAATALSTIRSSVRQRFGRDVAQGVAAVCAVVELHMRVRGQARAHGGVPAAARSEIDVPTNSVATIVKPGREVRLQVVDPVRVDVAGEHHRVGTPRCRGSPGCARGPPVAVPLVQVDDLPGPRS